MTDTITLRKLAEAATQGQWISENVPGAGVVLSVPYKNDVRIAFTDVWKQFPETEWDQETWANAEYTAAANPTAIIALLDEIDSLRAALAQQAEQVPERRTLYECRGCGHLHSEKLSSCDCMENGANEYNEWTASPNKN